MQREEYEAASQFSQPFRQILLMLVILGLVATGAYFAFPSVGPVFLTNPYLNGIIMGVFGVGVLACFWQVLALITAVNWIEGYALGRPGHENVPPPRLLVSLATMLRSRGAQVQISASSSRSLLDSLATRLDETRDITRYITNLLIFLGLLGTFYGLATTVPAVVDTIRSLAPSENEGGIEVFGRLMSGLEEQLGGMGVAFASSLLGLAGSLVVGLLDLFAGHGQNRFYRELEEWLSTITSVGFAAGDGEGGAIDQSAVARVIEQMIGNIDALHNMQTQSDVSRSETDTKLTQVTKAVVGLTQKLDAQMAAAPAPQKGGMASEDTMKSLDRIAIGQEQLLDHMRKTSDDGQVDAESRMRLRSIDVQLLRILEEMSAGRQDTVAELRSDIAALTKTIRQASRSTASTASGGRKGKA